MANKNLKKSANSPTLNTLINEDKLEQASEVLRALVHPLRLKIISFIDQHKVSNVNNIYSSLSIEQSIASQHLRILRQTNLVLNERDGKQIFYRLNYERIAMVHEAIKLFNSTNASNN